MKQFVRQIRTGWLLLAVLLGWLVSSQPPTISLFFLGGIILSISALITPLATIAILLILAPLRSMIATGFAWPLPLDIGQIAFLVVLAATAFYFVIERPRVRWFQPVEIYLPMLVFILAAAISGIYAVSFRDWITELSKWIVIVIAMQLAVIVGRKHWRILVHLLVATGVSNALVGLYVFFGGSGADHLLIRPGFFRAVGTFEQPNPFGGFMALLLPLAIAFAYSSLIQMYHEWQSARTIRRASLIYFACYGCATLIIGAGLVASWSRGAWLGFAVAFAVMVFALPRKLSQSMTAVSLLIGVIALFWFVGLVPDSIADRVGNVAEQYLSFSDVRGVDINPVNYAGVERVAHWQAALNMTREHPWTGIGFGNYEAAYAEYRLVNWPIALGHAHNYYLNILAEAGIIGLLAYLGMWISTVYFTWQTRQHPDTQARATAIGLLGAWAHLATHSLIDNLYVNNTFIHIGIMLGILVILYQQIKPCKTWGVYDAD